MAREPLGACGGGFLAATAAPFAAQQAERIDLAACLVAEAGAFAEHLLALGLPALLLRLAAGQSQGGLAAHLVELLVALAQPGLGGLDLLLATGLRIGLAC